MGDCPVAEQAYEELLTLPLFPAMTEADCDDCVAAVRKVLAAYALPPAAKINDVPLAV